jgi:hypothetical protein
MEQDSTLQHYTGYKASELKECVTALHELQCNTKKCTLPAIREKYCQHKVNLHCTFLPNAWLSLAFPFKKWLFWYWLLSCSSNVYPSFCLQLFCLLSTSVISNWIPSLAGQSHDTKTTFWFLSKKLTESLRLAKRKEDLFEPSALGKLMKLWHY